MKKIRLRDLMRLLRGNMGLLILILLFAAGGSGLSLYAPTVVGAAIDRIAGPGQVDFQGLIQDALRLALIYIGSALLLWGCTSCSVHLSADAVYRLRLSAFRRLSILPLSDIDGGQRGDFISRFSGDADAVAEGLHQLTTQLFTGLVTAFSALFFMLRISGALTAAVVLVTPLIFLVSRTVTKLSTAKFREQQRLIGNLSGFAEEQIRGLRTLKAYGAEGAAADQFSAINRELYGVGQKAQFYSSLTNPSTRFVNYISYILVGVAGGILAIRHSFSIGAVAAFLTYSALWAKPFNEISAVTTQILSALAALGRIYELTDRPPQSPDAPFDGAEPEIRGEVEFSHVDFSYSPERPLLRDFSVKIAPGSTVAIVGPTGAGKTTLVNLLMRFYEIDAGAIFIDGQDIRTLPRDFLRRCFGMVLQDSWLFRGTILENIAYGAPDATEDEIIAAAKAAGAHGFIRRLPEGYGTRVSEGGENLSLGQRQLLTIARAMLLDPPMLILDEATSSVDVMTERRIQKAFRRAMEGRTSFVIAHRLSTIRDADRILVMKDGAVIEQGTHFELLDKGGFYKELYSSQFEAAND